MWRSSTSVSVLKTVFGGLWRCSTQEVKEGGPGAGGYPWLHRGFEASLGYVRSRLKKGQSQKYHLVRIVRMKGETNLKGGSQVAGVVNWGSAVSLMCNTRKAWGGACPTMLSGKFPIPGSEQSSSFSSQVLGNRCLPPYLASGETDFEMQWCGPFWSLGWPWAMQNTWIQNLNLR